MRRSGFVTFVGFLLALGSLGTAVAQADPYVPDGAVKVGAASLNVAA